MDLEAVRGIIWKGGDTGAGDLTFALVDGEAVDRKDVLDQGCELEDYSWVGSRLGVVFEGGNGPGALDIVLRVLRVVLLL